MNFINPSKILREKINLQPGTCVAELGCGHGFFILEAAKIIGQEGKLHAVDVQKTALSALRDKIKLENIQTNIEYIWADIEIVGATKIPESSCDLVILSNVLFQSKKVDKMMEECKRVVKQEGKILIIDWKQKGAADGGPPANLRVDLNKLKEIIQNLGMQIAEEFEASRFHWGLIVRK